jgi:hypothetical protein
MIKLTSLLKEAAKENKELSDLKSIESAVHDFFEKNKKKFEKLADEDEWDDFYELAYEKFPEADQDDVAQSVNKAALKFGIFETDEDIEMPSEKDLEKLSFGEKSQQKGIKMGDYDKKQKMPKQSSSDLFAESTKKKF